MQSDLPLLFGIIPGDRVVFIVCDVRDALIECLQGGRSLNCNVWTFKQKKVVVFIHFVPELHPWQRLAFKNGEESQVAIVIAFKSS